MLTLRNILKVMRHETSYRKPWTQQRPRFAPQSDFSQEQEADAATTSHTKEKDDADTR